MAGSISGAGEEMGCNAAESCNLLGEVGRRITKRETNIFIFSSQEVELLMPIFMII